MGATKRRVRAAIAVAFAGVAGLGAAASASAAITMGPASLDPADTIANVAQPSTLISTGNSDGKSQAVAPFDGVIVEWRALADYYPQIFDATVSLRVARPLPIGDQFLALRSDTVPAPTDEAGIVGAEDVRIPIRAGDVIGLTTKGGVNARIVSALPEGREVYVNGTLPDGSSGALALVVLGGMAPVQADIEPDEDGDGWGDESQDGCPTDANTHGPCGAETVKKVRSRGRKKIKVQVVCPSGRETACSGELAVDSNRALKLGRSHAQIAFGQKSYSVETGERGKVGFKLTSAERKLLRKKKRIKVVARIFPEYGAASTKKGKLKA
jgi:hypothetical protein